MLAPEQQQQNEDNNRRGKAEDEDRTLPGAAKNDFTAARFFRGVGRLPRRSCAVGVFLHDDG